MKSPISKLCILFFFLFSMLLEAADDKKVMIAILARNKEHVLSRYLKSLEALDYDKKLISVYINTNDNEDKTAQILEDWTEKNKEKYAKIELEHYKVPGNPVARPHEWSPTRFKILGNIRNKSLTKTKEMGCDYYFVVDCDNFLTPCTLKELLSKDKPIIAPMLKAIPEKGDCYSNYFCAVNNSGYYDNHPDYLKILTGEKVGTFQEPVVHCTYLIKQEVLDKLTYVDGSDDYEFVIFSNTARNNDVDQYLCNEKDFGTLIHFYEDLTLQEEKSRVDALNL